MWYIVRPGDSLYILAKRYGTTVEDISNANNLTSLILNIGQRLYIPLSDKIIRYTVKAGDSLYSIAQAYNTTVSSISSLNNLTNTQLYIGQSLIIPRYSEVVVKVDNANIRNGAGVNSKVIARMDKGARLELLSEQSNWYLVRLYNGNKAWVFANNVDLKAYAGNKPILGILGFYTLYEGPSLPSSFASFVQNKDNISMVGLFLWQISRDDPTQIVPFGQFTDTEINTLVNIAHRSNIKIVPVVHNLLYKPGGTKLAKELIKELVSTPENRKEFSENLLELIEKYNFDGVNIDIEDAFVDDKERISLLYKEIANTITPKGYYLSASIPSRISDEPFNPFSDPFDYAAIGKSVDQFVVMLYNEFGWPGSPPGPPVTAGWMDKVLRYTLTRVPAEKVVAAVSVFGFDFNTTTGKVTYVTYDAATKLAEKYNKEITFDEERETPTFSYTDDEGNKHEVWFEDAQSIKAKADLAWKLGIDGLALWRLGMEDIGIWTMLTNDVVVKNF